MVAARRTLFLAPLLYALPATAQLAGKLDLSASCQGSAASLITTRMFLVQPRSTPQDEN